MKIFYDYHVVELTHEQDRHAIFVGRDAGQNIRCVAKAAPWGPNSKPFVSAVHVDDGARQKGIATGLMEFIGDRAAANNNETLALYVHQDNIPARRLYDRLGFTEYLDDGDNILMAVRIDKMLEERAK